MTLTIKNNEINSNEILESACAKLLAYDINGSIIKRKKYPDFESIKSYVNGNGKSRLLTTVEDKLKSD